MSKRAKDRFDAFIVGCGFSGAVIARQLAEAGGMNVLISDRRPHIGGNAFDRFDESGIRIHPYGPHIFHTNSEMVFNFLSSFTKWRHYEHRVLASVDGKLLPIPINIDTLNGLYGLNLNEESFLPFLQSRAESRTHISTSEDVALTTVGRELYEKFFRNYTRKQWGLDASQLDSSVLARIPVRSNHDDRYFTDRYQCMPADGFARLFENMLDHPRIQIALNAEFQALRKEIDYGILVFTGPIDSYFDYRFGPLPYRSLRFDHKTLPVESFQPVAVVNYPNEHDYTRVTEFKKLTGQSHGSTSIVYEYPESSGDPFYPIPCSANRELYKKYESLAAEERNTVFAGRLGTYRYYNMDQVVAQALTLARGILESRLRGLAVA